MLCCFLILSPFSTVWPGHSFVVAIRPLLVDLITSVVWRLSLNYHCSTRKSCLGTNVADSVVKRELLPKASKERVLELGARELINA
jgi:hypothetical protein